MFVSLEHEVFGGSRWLNNLARHGYHGSRDTWTTMLQSFLEAGATTALHFLAYLIYDCSRRRTGTVPKLLRSKLMSSTCRTTDWIMSTWARSLRQADGVSRQRCCKAKTAAAKIKILYGKVRVGAQRRQQRWFFEATSGARGYKAQGQLGHCERVVFGCSIGSLNRYSNLQIRHPAPTLKSHLSIIGRIQQTCSLYENSPLPPHPHPPAIHFAQYVQLPAFIGPSSLQRSSTGQLPQGA